jgi:hypothetical protein
MPKSQQSWVLSQHPPTQWNLKGAADEAVLNNVHQKKITNKIPFKKNSLNCSFLFFRRGESDPDPGQPDRPAIGGGGGDDEPPQQGGAEGRVADPDWIRIQSGQWIRIRIQEGKNDAQK